MPQDDDAGYKLLFSTPEVVLGFIPEIRGLEELKMTLAEKFDQWAKEYKQEGQKEGRKEGKKEGKREGEALVLQRLLSRRFDPLPPEVLARIASASEEDINQWVDRILDADCLEDVFRP
jgi:flagellar biosynthesis/type III secretory pathway protein FliH